MKRIENSKYGKYGCLGIFFTFLALCITPSVSIASPKLRMVSQVVRWTVFLLPLLFILHFCGVPIPKELLPISFLCFFPLLCFLFSRLRGFFEKFPTPKSQPESEAEEVVEKQPIPALLIFYALILLTLVFVVNLPLLRAGVLFPHTTPFFIFGAVTCFIFTGFIRELRIHYIFAALLYTIVAGLWLIVARYGVFPFFWTLFAVCLGSLLVADKHHRIKTRRGGTLSLGVRRLFLLVLIIFCLVGGLISFRQIKTNWELYEIRHASVSEIQEIVFTQKESSREIVLTQPKKIAEFQKGMATSFIFSKKKGHSYSDYAPWWQVKLIWRDGRTRQFSIGKGTGYFSDAAFVRFTENNDHFQSRALYQTLQPLLWPEKKGVKQ